MLPDVKRYQGKIKDKRDIIRFAFDKRNFIKEERQKRDKLNDKKVPLCCFRNAS